MSGISGGSLGIATYLAMHQDLGLSKIEKRAELQQLNQNFLGQDFLAPTLSHILFSESLYHFGPFFDFPDAAAIMERSWETPWQVICPNRNCGLKKSFRKFTISEQPLVFLSSMDASSGQRVNVSSINTGCDKKLAHNVMNINDGLTSWKEIPASCQRMNTHNICEDIKNCQQFPATFDFFDRHPQDIRLSTATLLSARFPYITPAGIVAAGIYDRTHLVDGGYLDATGTQISLEIFNHLRFEIEKFNQKSTTAMIVPLYIHIENNNRRTAIRQVKTDSISQWLLPIAGVFNSSNYVPRESLKQVQLIFQYEVDEDYSHCRAFFQFDTYRNPGAIYRSVGYFQLRRVTN